YLTLNMLKAVWDCCALTLFTHKIITIILNVNIGGIAVKSPQRVLGLRAGKVRTCNGTPGPQATPIFIKYT
ncbi:hypothetical protein ACFFGT_19590, partial [Mucilaginibacter angelicae]